MTSAQNFNYSKSFLTLKEAADFIGLKPQTIYQLCWQRKIPFYKPGGGHLLFAREELEAWIKAGKVPTRDELEARATDILNGGAQ